MVKLTPGLGYHLWLHIYRYTLFKSELFRIKCEFNWDQALINEHSFKRCLSLSVDLVRFLTFSLAFKSILDEHDENVGLFLIVDSLELIGFLTTDAVYKQPFLSYLRHMTKGLICYICFTAAMRAKPTKW